jgi:hypothetical protein
MEWGLEVEKLHKYPLQRKKYAVYFEQKFVPAQNFKNILNATLWPWCDNVLPSHFYHTPDMALLDECKVVVEWW